MTIYLDLFRTFFKIGAFTFGGGYAMIPLIEKEIVDEKNWIHREDILDLFAVSQSIPGAIAINTSTLVGYKIKGKRGAIAATLGVILPSFLIIISIAVFFIQIADSKWVHGAFKGINGAVILLILTAAAKMMKTALKDPVTWGLFAITVLLLIMTNVSPILCIIAGGLLGGLRFFIKKGDKNK